MFSKKLFSAVFSALLCFSSITFAADQVDINRADVGELALVLKGVGESKALAIVEHRKQHGPFQSLDQLADVKGIGKSLITQNRDRIKINIEKQ